MRPYVPCAKQEGNRTSSKIRGESFLRRPAYHIVSFLFFFSCDVSCPPQRHLYSVFRATPRLYTCRYSRGDREESPSPACTTTSPCNHHHVQGYRLAVCGEITISGGEPMVVCCIIIYIYTNDTQTGMLPSARTRAQFAFKNSMIHEVLQFTLVIAVGCVLHRCENQDIHR